MVDIKANTVKIGGRVYGNGKADYPSIPTVFSGVEVQWGAESCIDNPEASRATVSLWVPKTYENWVPNLGEVIEIDASIPAGGDLTSTYAVRIFSGKIESIKLQDDHKEPTFLIPNSRNMTAMTGWVSSYATSATGAFTNMDSSVSFPDAYTFRLPWMNQTTDHIFSLKTPKIPVEEGKKYTFSFMSNFTGSETVTYTFYNASGGVVSSGSTTTGTWDRVGFSAITAGIATVGFEIKTALVPKGSIPYYDVSNVTLSHSDARAEAGYRVNITAADALAEAARLRLSSDGYMPFEYALNRQKRIADLATKAGVTFYSGLTEEQGYYEANDTMVMPRDMDSFPALEAFQRATMAAGHTVISSNNVVQPSVRLKLPQVLSATQPVSATYSYDSTGYPKHYLKNGSTIVRTNWASNATATTSLGVASSQYFNVYAGGSTDASIYMDSEYAKIGSNSVAAEWFANSVSGQNTGIYYKQAGITGATGSRVSGGAWVMSWQAKTVKCTVTAYNGATSVGSVTSANITLPAKTWIWASASGVSATGAYDTVEVAITLATGTMTYSQSNREILYLDGVLIEKTATAGSFFDSLTLDPAATVFPDVRAGVPVFPASAIVDDVFELDTSRVVNEIKVEMHKVQNALSDPPTMTQEDQVYTDELGSRKTTPQTRSIATDWAVNDFWDDATATSVMVTKGKLLLAGQSRPTWRLSSSMALVLSMVDTQEAIYKLIRESERFGALIRISNGPSLVPEYMRVRGGKIVLGESPQLEFDLEPVEYSAPIPLNGSTLHQDHVASNYKFRNAKTLTFNDLRTVGAR